VYHQRPTRATIFRIDSSFDGDGEGSERRSPRDRTVSLDEDFSCVLDRKLDEPEVAEVAESAVEEVTAAVNVDGLDEDVEVEDADVRTIIPATGICTMHRRRLSKPCVPRSLWILSLAGLRLMLASDRYIVSFSFLTARRVRTPIFTISWSRMLISR
jgi:hypothetical protein